MVVCPHCKAPTGQVCHSGTVPLALSQAHPSRLEAAGLPPDYSAVMRYRSLHLTPGDERPNPHPVTSPGH
jgi:hypothetical protein